MMSLIRNIQKPYATTMRLGAPIRLSSVIRSPRRGGPRSSVLQSCDLVGPQSELILVAPGEYYKRGDGTQKGEPHEPPDMPDHREAQHRGEERADEPSRTVAWNLDAGDFARARSWFVSGWMLDLPEC